MHMTIATIAPAVKSPTGLSTLSPSSHHAVNLPQAIVGAQQCGEARERTALKLHDVILQAWGRTSLLQLLQ